MVRNMQAIRFMNPIFQDVWNAKYIEHVQISALETVGVENRGGYYDQSGAFEGYGSESFISDFYPLSLWSSLSTFFWRRYASETIRCIACIALCRKA